MRKRLACPKCQHNHILLVENVADAGSHRWDVNPANVAIALAEPGKPGDVTVGAGKLSAAVCRACGYTELYTADPGSIPVDGKYVREVIGPDPVGPYR
jgi:predicted nucleic-acid-binding Zn-ribbon protein